MLCPDCKHQNAAANRFCGMCGARLQWPEGKSYTPDVSPDPVDPLVTMPQWEEAPSQQYGEYTDALLHDLSEGYAAGQSPHVREEEVPHSATEHDPVAPEYQARSGEPAAPGSGGVHDDLRVDVLPLHDLRENHLEESRESASETRAISIGGPSFLGLGEPARGGEYNYLLEEEKESSHTGRWVALALLLVLAAGVGVLASNWHGSRDWAVTKSAALRQRIQSWRSAPAAEPTPTEQAENSTAEQPATQDDATAAAVPQEGTQQESTPGQPEFSQVRPPEGNAAGTSVQPPSSDAGGDAPAPAKNSSASDAGVQNPEWEQAQKGNIANGQDKAAAANSEVAANTKAPGKTGQTANRKAASVETNVEKAPAEKTPEADGEDLVVRGERFLYGQGVRRDCNQALVYFRAGAERQNARALSRMGALYATGTCVPMDRVMAYNWFSRALAQDSRNPLLEENLNMLWRDMDSRERQQVLEPRDR